MKSFNNIIIIFICLFLFSGCALAPAETIETISNTIATETMAPPPTISAETQKALTIIQDTIDSALKHYKYKVYESNDYIYVDIWVQNIYSALRSESATFNDSWYKLLVEIQQTNLQLQFLIRNTDYDNKITISLYETLGQTDVLLMQTYNGEIVFDYLTVIRKFSENN